MRTIKRENLPWHVSSSSSFFVSSRSSCSNTYKTHGRI
jgi:hypothetical protein